MRIPRSELKQAAAQLTERADRLVNQTPEQRAPIRTALLLDDVARAIDPGRPGGTGDASRALPLVDQTKSMLSRAVEALARRDDPPSAAAAGTTSDPALAALYGQALTELSAIDASGAVTRRGPERLAANLRSMAEALRRHAGQSPVRPPRELQTVHAVAHTSRGEVAIHANVAVRDHDRSPDVRTGGVGQQLHSLDRSAQASERRAAEDGLLLGKPYAAAQQDEKTALAQLVPRFTPEDLGKYIQTDTDRYNLAMRNLFRSPEGRQKVFDAISLLVGTIPDHQVWTAGNGGSHDVAAHLAHNLTWDPGANFDGVATRAEVLTGANNELTARGNDLGFNYALVTMLEQKARAGDVFVAVSGSGNSENLLMAVKAAKARGVKVIAITQKDSPLERAADVGIGFDVRVPGNKAKGDQQVLENVQNSMLHILARGVLVQTHHLEPEHLGKDFAHLATKEDSLFQYMKKYGPTKELEMAMRVYERVRSLAAEGGE